MRRARVADPVTSWAAARNANPNLDKTLRSVILSALQTFGPMTHDQLIDIVTAVRPASPSGVRTRCRELFIDGYVEPVPEMNSRSKYGRASLLWRAVRQ